MRFNSTKYNSYIYINKNPFRSNVVNEINHGKIDLIRSNDQMVRSKD